MDEIRLTVHPFRMGTDKEAAVKPLEESAETFAAWQNWQPYDKEPTCSADCDGLGAFTWAKAKKIRLKILSDEIADCIQACVNLAHRYGIDLAPAMERCERRNRERGRYEMDSDGTPLDADRTPLDAGGDHECCGRCHETSAVKKTVYRGDGVGHSECGRCGRTVGPQFRFCPWCGARFEDAEVDDGMH